MLEKCELTNCAPPSRTRTRFEKQRQNEPSTSRCGPIAEERRAEEAAALAASRQVEVNVLKLTIKGLRNALAAEKSRMEVRGKANVLKRCEPDPAAQSEGRARGGSHSDTFSR